jgi:hypothetical protein
VPVTASAVGQIAEIKVTTREQTVHALQLADRQLSIHAISTAL